MRDPQQVLNALCEHSKDYGLPIRKALPNSVNEEMFFIAYQRTYTNQGNMTPGSDGRTIDRMSIDRIRKIVASLRMNLISPILPVEYTFLKRMERNARWVFPLLRINSCRKWYI